MDNEEGFSLIELLVVIVIISTIVFLLANLPNAFLLMAKSKHLSLAREIASKQIEDKRAMQFGNLVNDTTQISDVRLRELPNGSGTTTVADCDLTICTNEENIKKITVSILWKDNQKTQSVILDTLLSEGGINQ
ncbi:prepilin-type N-terminal cleavage/methylation domain-containing protein [Candidatus Daviesbacteria bacterium]|nr:prepilin-type N-terminal cleavage/methylation domain-containing protein [Candidatus Daviesbacteria bacterium]